MITDIVHERRVRRKQDTRPFADACLTYQERLLRDLQRSAPDAACVEILKSGQRPRIFLAKSEGADYDRPLTPLPHRTWSSMDGGTVPEPKRSLWERMKGLVAS